MSTHLFMPSKKALRDMVRKNIRPNVLTSAMPQKYPPVNFNVLGFAETAKRLVGIIKDISKSTGLKNVFTVVAGVSGARYEKDRKKLETFIKAKTKIKNVHVLADTEIAFASAFRPDQKNCGILIAGTGSILYYRDNRHIMYRVGGWGRMFGDEGSGYWIARNALSHITKFYDKRGKKTQLTDLINENYGLNEETLIGKIYHDGFSLARIAKLVFKAAEKGDPVCTRIIKDAAEELAGHFAIIKKKNYTIALMGSLFSEEKLLELELKKIIKSDYPNINIIKPNFRPVWGAVRIGNAIVVK